MRLETLIQACVLLSEPPKALRNIKILLSSQRIVEAGTSSRTIMHSQTDHIFAKDAVVAMLNEHREGVVDNSRRLWTVLMFMVWHGIFVEGTIVPEIIDHTYPVRV